jgi:ParB-like chromosome segregation protein Spo0J
MVTLEDAKTTLRRAVEASGDPTSTIEALRALMHDLSPQRHNPVDWVRWIPIDQVEANDYNPNAVAMNEMRLLHVSITHDGYTQPVVVVFDPERSKFVIVDGFHRYTTMRLNPELLARNGGLLPCVVLNKSINDRMASTVRHNRARGKHSITGMASMVFTMLENGWTDEAICAEIGVSVDELVRLKHVTGFSKLFENADYKRAWETTRQIELRRDHKKANPA